MVEWAKYACVNRLKRKDQFLTAQKFQLDWLAYKPRRCSRIVSSAIKLENKSKIHSLAELKHRAFDRNQLADLQLDGNQADVQSSICVYDVTVTRAKLFKTAQKMRAYNEKQLLKRSATSTTSYPSSTGIARLCIAPTNVERN